MDGSLMNFAAEIDSYIYGFDPQGYEDAKESWETRDDMIQKTYDEILDDDKRNIIIQFMEEIIEESPDSKAESILNRLKNIKSEDYILDAIKKDLRKFEEEEFDIDYEKSKDVHLDMHCENLAYTQFGDDNQYEIQTSLDLTNLLLYMTINGYLVMVQKFSSLSKIREEVTSRLYFNYLIFSLCPEELIEMIENWNFSEEDIKMRLIIYETELIKKYPCLQK